MAWTKENGSAGLPVWRGKDEILNILKASHKGQTKHLNILIVFVFGGFGVVTLLLASALGPRQAGPLWIMGAAFIAAIFALLPLAKKLASQDEFEGAWWTLTPSNDGLEYRTAQERLPLQSATVAWAAPLDTVARVETGRTAEYTPSRQYREYWGTEQTKLVSKHEWQTFLFLNDGTRRVIYHANADRDGCAALAASIREYVESARAGAAPSSSSTHDAADGSAPRAAGFDL